MLARILWYLTKRGRENERKRSWREIASMKLNKSAIRAWTYSRYLGTELSLAAFQVLSEYFQTPIIRLTARVTHGFRALCSYHTLPRYFSIVLDISWTSSGGLRWQYHFVKSRINYKMARIQQKQVQCTVVWTNRGIMEYWPTKKLWTDTWTLIFDLLAKYGHDKNASDKQRVRQNRKKSKQNVKIVPMLWAPGVCSPPAQTVCIFPNQGSATQLRRYRSRPDNRLKNGQPD